MNVLFKNIEDVNINNIYFLEKKKNNILNNGFFVKILYYDKNVTINGLLILYDEEMDLYLFEQEILNHYIKEIYAETFNFNKKLVYNLSKFLKKNIKEYLGINLLSLYKNSSLRDTILKISGIWETETEIGITFKYIKM